MEERLHLQGQAVGVGAGHRQVDGGGGGAGQQQTGRSEPGHGVSGWSQGTRWNWVDSRGAGSGSGIGWKNGMGVMLPSRCHRHRRFGRPDPILVAVPLPRLLMWLVDPANVYFADHTPRRGRPRRGPRYRGAAVFGPDVPGGSRQATPEEIAELRRRAPSSRADADAAPRPPVDPAALAQAARDLLTQGWATLGTSPHLVHARVVRFWHGDCVLDVTDEAGRSRSLARIPRHLGPEHEAVLTGYLAEHLGHT